MKKDIIIISIIFITLGVVAFGLLDYLYLEDASGNSVANTSNLINNNDSDSNGENKDDDSKTDVDIPSDDDFDENDNKELKLILLDKEGGLLLDECGKRGLSDKIILLESKYCSACKVVIPRLQEIEIELGVDIIYLDLSKKEDQDRAKEFKIWPKYTPTVLIGCDVFIGAYSKEKYKEVIENFLSY